MDYALIWTALLGVAVLFYVILDGFDLGVGILFPFLNAGDERDVAMNTLAPVWDGNETWLILGGGGLMAAFPLAFAIIIPAVYAPIMVMLLGLVFRGVAFEYKWRSVNNARRWEWAFAAGSFAATFCQGLILGTLIQGIEIEGRSYAGGWFSWLTPFSLVTGIALILGYCLLGSGWLILKTEGGLQTKAYKAARLSLFGTLAFMGLVSLWTPMMDPQIAARWFSLPNFYYLLPVPLLVLVLALGAWRAIGQRLETRVYPIAVGLFILGFVGLAISLYPYLIPGKITIWEAAAPDKSLSFMLVGAVILLPMILAYTAYAYHVFRGKVRPSDGYH